MAKLLSPMATCDRLGFYGAQREAPKPAGPGDSEKDSWARLISNLKKCREVGKVAPGRGNVWVVLESPTWCPCKYPKAFYGAWILLWFPGAKASPIWEVWFAKPLPIIYPPHLLNSTLFGPLLPHKHPQAHCHPSFWTCCSFHLGLSSPSPSLGQLAAFTSPSQRGLSRPLF